MDLMSKIFSVIMALDSADDMCVAVTAECIQELHLSLHFALALQLQLLQIYPLRVCRPYAGPTCKIIEGVIKCSWMSDNNWVIYMHTLLTVLNP